MSPAYAWTTRDVVTVTGPDARAYLQGQLSQDVDSLAIGSASATFVLAPQGKVDGWGWVRRADAETYVIDTDPGAGEQWDQRLRRFLLRTDATIDTDHEVPTLAIRGRAIAGGRAWSIADVADASGVSDVSGVPDVAGVDVIGVARGEVPPELADAVEIDAEGLEARRIRAGIPRWGAEIDGDTIPATLGQRLIDASVSFTKGCYTGQELVARIDSRGGNVPRRLVGLEVEGPAPAPGDEVLVAGAPVATVTSAAADADGVVALAFLPRSIELDGHGLEAEVGGHPARLRTLPFG